MLGGAVAVAVVVTRAVVTAELVDVVVLASSVIVPTTATVDVFVTAAGVVIKQLQAEESTFWASALSCERLATCRFLKGPGVGGGVLEDKSINRSIESQTRVRQQFTYVVTVVVVVVVVSVNSISPTTTGSGVIVAVLLTVVVLNTVGAAVGTLRNKEQKLLARGAIRVMIEVAARTAGAVHTGATWISNSAGIRGTASLFGIAEPVMNGLKRSTKRTLRRAAMMRGCR